MLKISASKSSVCLLLVQLLYLYAAPVAAQSLNYAGAVTVAVIVTAFGCVIICVVILCCCQRRWKRKLKEKDVIVENGRRPELHGRGYQEDESGYVNISYESEAPQQAVMAGIARERRDEVDDGGTQIILSANDREDLMFKMAEMDGKIIVTEDPVKNSKSHRQGIRKGDIILGAFVRFDGNDVHPGDVADILSFIDDYDMELLFEHKVNVHRGALAEKGPVPVPRKDKRAPSPPPYDADSVFQIKDRRRRRQLTPLPPGSYHHDTEDSMREFVISGSSDDVVTLGNDSGLCQDLSQIDDSKVEMKTWKSPGVRLNLDMDRSKTLPALPLDHSKIENHYENSDGEEEFDVPTSQLIEAVEEDVTAQMSRKISQAPPVYMEYDDTGHVDVSNDLVARSPDVYLSVHEASPNEDIRLPDETEMDASLDDIELNLEVENISRGHQREGSIEDPDFSTELGGELNVEAPDFSPEIEGDICIERPDMSPELGGELNVEAPDFSPEIEGDLSIERPDMSPELGGELNVEAPDFSPEVEGDFSFRRPDLSPELRGELYVEAEETLKYSPELRGSIDIEAPDFSPEIEGDFSFRRPDLSPELRGELDVEAEEVLKYSPELRGSIDIEAPDFSPEVEGDFSFRRPNLSPELRGELEEVLKYSPELKGTIDIEAPDFSPEIEFSGSKNSPELTGDVDVPDFSPEIEVEESPVEFKVRGNLQKTPVFQEDLKTAVSLNEKDDADEASESSSSSSRKSSKRHSPKDISLEYRSKKTEDIKQSEKVLKDTGSQFFSGDIRLPHFKQGEVSELECTDNSDPRFPLCIGERKGGLTQRDIDYELQIQSPHLSEFEMQHDPNRVWSSSGYVSSRTPTNLDEKFRTPTLQEFDKRSSGHSSFESEDIRKSPTKKSDFVQVRASPAFIVPQGELVDIPISTGAKRAWKDLPNEVIRKPIETGEQTHRRSIDAPAAPVRTGKYGWIDLTNQIVPNESGELSATASRGMTVGEAKNKRKESGKTAGDRRRSYIIQEEAKKKKSSDHGSSDEDEEPDPLLQEYLEKARQLDDEVSTSGPNSDNEDKQKMSKHADSGLGRSEGRMSPKFTRSETFELEAEATPSRVQSDSPLLDEKLLATIEQSSKNLWDSDPNMDSLPDQEEPVNISDDESQLSENFQELLENENNLTGEEFQRMMQRLEGSESESEV